MQEPDELVTTAAYQPEPSTAAEARRFVRETLRSWGVPGPAARAADLIDDVVLLTSELVTNAVVHAGTEVQVTCRMTSTAVKVAVRTGTRPVLSASPPSGRRSGGRTSGRACCCRRRSPPRGGDLRPHVEGGLVKIAFADRPAGEIVTSDAPAAVALPVAGNGIPSSPADLLALCEAPDAELDDLLYDGMAAIEAARPPPAGPRQARLRRAARARGRDRA